MATDEFMKELAALLDKFPEESKDFEVVDAPGAVESPRPEATNLCCKRIGRREDGTLVCLEWGPC